MWFLLCFLLPALTDGFFSLYLSTGEVRQLLGMGREMYYVSDGEVKQNALDLSFPLSQDTDQLHFHWFANPTNVVRYAIKVTSSDPESLHQPHLNISHQGTMSEATTVWRVTLPCSGLKKANVKVTLDLRFEEEASKETREIRIKREKQCMGEDQVSKDILLIHSEDGRVLPHQIFAGILFGAIILMIFLATSIFCVHSKQRKKFGDMRSRMSSSVNNIIVARSTGKSSNFDLNQFQPEFQIQNNSSDFQYEPRENMYPGQGKPPSLPPPSIPPPPLPLMNPLYPNEPFNPPMSEEAESRVTDWIQQQTKSNQDQYSVVPVSNLSAEEIMEQLKVDRLLLKLGQLLQEGTFSRIYQGTLLHPESSEEIDVYIKTVVAGSSAKQSENLIRDATLLYGTTHNHVQTLISSTWDGTSPMLIYPYMNCGNLKKFLQQNNQISFSTHNLVSLSLQLLKALQHLHKRKILHKDVATRNCFICNGNYLKLSDASLSKDLFPTDYHCLGDNENRPIKWMPPEAISKKKHSRASDVWSCGVFMWELMTRAQQPFADIDPFEMESYLLEGYRLHQPMNCPDQLYSVLVQCWALSASERASVHNLYSQLQNLQRQLQQFV